MFFKIDLSLNFGTFEFQVLLSILNGFLCVDLQKNGTTQTSIIILQKTSEDAWINAWL